MEELYKILMAVVNGANSPWITAIGAIAALVLGLFGLQIKARMRADKASREKESDKERELDRIEDDNSVGDGNIRDRLNQRNNNDNIDISGKDPGTPT
ncbi:MAG: hypothetical protein PHY47_00910 [Lachnospiraceae bacterium]|nr:hypothetical protein [Lachnospiraceae bacterium]